MRRSGHCIMQMTILDPQPCVYITVKLMQQPLLHRGKLHMPTINIGFGVDGMQTQIADRNVITGGVE
jgi:hypothetical protein